MRRSGSAHQRSAHQRILQCKKEGHWQDAIQILTEAAASGRNLGTVSYNAAIDSCSKAKQVGRALELFDELVQAGNVPDAVTYTALIDACGRGGLLDQAFALFARCVLMPIAVSKLHPSARSSARPPHP
jgi:pentatricopeptide repeat protein